MSGPVANNIFRASGVVAAAAGGLNWDSTILTALTTFTVTVNNPGVGNRYYIDGVLQQTLNLLEGFTYKFDQSDSSNSGHPLRFSTTSGGTHSGGSEYTTGVTTSGTPGNAGAYTQIVVAASAPLLYYYCTNHNYMGGTANTVGETVEANRGYWIDTTSTTCTITLPSSPSKGDQIILVDYARTWGTNKITINAGSSNYQGQDNTYTIEYSTDGEVLNIVYSDATKGWIPQDDDEVADVPVAPATQRAIFGFGNAGSGYTGITNLVNSSGVVQADVSAVGTARRQLTATNFGGDKAIFFGGVVSPGGNANASRISNIVNNSGVVQSDVANSSGSVTVKYQTAMLNYGSTGQAFSGFGTNSSEAAINLTNLITNQGVIGNDVSGVSGATARTASAGAPYGDGLGIVAYGSGPTNISNKISNQGVVAADTSGVGTARVAPGSAGYGGDKAIFAYGEYTAHVNLVSNTGVVASDTTAAQPSRSIGAGASYGGDKALFYGGNAEGTTPSGKLNVYNLCTNQGVVGSYQTGVGSGRSNLGGATYSYST